MKFSIFILLLFSQILCTGQTLKFSGQETSFVLPMHKILMVEIDSHTNYSNPLGQDNTYVGLLQIGNRAIRYKLFNKTTHQLVSEYASIGPTPLTFIKKPGSKSEDYVYRNDTDMYSLTIEKITEYPDAWIELSVAFVNKHVSNNHIRYFGVGSVYYNTKTNEARGTKDIY